MLLSVRHIPQPGNIDIRYGFNLNDEIVDIVCVNDRTHFRIHVYRVDPENRSLIREDDNTLLTNENYGLCMYKSPVNGKYYVFTVDKTGTVQQFYLHASVEG